MSTFTIDSNLQNINFNGFDVQKLVYNGVQVWTKGSGPGPGPTPTYTLIDPYITIPQRVKSGQKSNIDYNYTATYTQYNFIDLQLCSSTDLENNDYKDARLIILIANSSKYVTGISYIKISEWLNSTYANSLYSTLENLGISDIYTWDSTIETAIRNWYSSNRANLGDKAYYAQIRDAYYTVANMMFVGYNGTYANPDLGLSHDGIRYNIDDSVTSTLNYTYKVNLSYKIDSSTFYYYPSTSNNKISDYTQSPIIYINGWSNLFIMLYNEYYLKRKQQ